MDRGTRILTVLVLIVLLTSACQPVPRRFAASPTLPVAGLDDATTAKIDAYVTEQQTRNKVPGLALGIVKDGQLVYAKALGVANAESGEPVTPKTVFRLSDVTTIPTTIAVLQLVEQGKIDLDAPVTTYLPYFQLKDEGYKAITVRQILENRSGLTDAGDIAQMWGTYPAANDAGAVERFVRAMSQPNSLVVPRLAFEPGEGYQHSYTARIILGDIIQKVTGQAYEEYVNENIFAPLGMENSTMLLDDVDPAKLASPHVVNKEDTNFQTANIVVSDLVPFSREFSASDNLYSNMEDMARLLEALLNGGELDGARILSPESVALMWTPSGDTSYDLQSWYTGKEHTIKIYGQYGMGGFIGEIAGHPVYHADGWQLGYRADVALVPDQGLALVVMGNRGQNERLSYASDELYANNMIPDVLSMLLGVE